MTKNIKAKIFDIMKKIGDLDISDRFEMIAELAQSKASKAEVPNLQTPNPSQNPLIPLTPTRTPSVCTSKRMPPADCSHFLPRRSLL